MTWKNLLSDHGLLLMRKDLSHYPNDQDEIKKKKKYLQGGYYQHFQHEFEWIL